MRDAGGSTTVWVVALAVSLVTGLGGPAWTQARAAARYPVSAHDLDAARAALQDLQVSAPAPATGYARERFGTAWADVDHNGCDTRNDVLRRDLHEPVSDPSDGCHVLSGTLEDPYTGTTVVFVRGERSADVQIDHVVPLALAWRTGAQRWPPDRRLAFANDPANLLAVEGSANQDKGDGDASTWLPPDAGYRCVYAVRQIRVKWAYGLWVTAAERAALGRALDGCVVG